MRLPKVKKSDNFIDRTGMPKQYDRLHGPSATWYEEDVIPLNMKIRTQDELLKKALKNRKK